MHHLTKRESNNVKYAGNMKQAWIVTKKILEDNILLILKRTLNESEIF